MSRAIVLAAAVLACASSAIGGDVPALRQSAVRSLIVPASERFDDGFACEDGVQTNGAIVLEGGCATSAKAYGVPIAIEYRVRTVSAAVRLGFGAEAITFGPAEQPDELRVEGGPASGRHCAGQGRLPTDKVVTIRQVVTDDGMALFVDGQRRGDWTGSFRGIDGPIRISAIGGTITLESVRIQPLAAGCSIVDELDPMTKLARGGMPGVVGGLHAYGEADPRTGEAREVRASFDVTRDWQLDLSMIAGDVSNYGQMVMVWGDTRAGKDTLYVRQRARSLEVGTWGQPDAYATAMLPEDRLKDWIPVMVRFDAAKSRLYLSIDGRAAADCPCGPIYFDRTMSVCLGQAFNGDQLFTGRVRDVVLENR